MPLKLEQMLAHGDCDSLSSIRRTDFVADTLDVSFHAVWRDVELYGDFAVGEAAHHGVDDAKLPFGELGCRRILLHELVHFW